MTDISPDAMRKLLQDFVDEFDFEVDADGKVTRVELPRGDMIYVARGKDLERKSLHKTASSAYKALQRMQWYDDLFFTVVGKKDEDA